MADAEEAFLSARTEDQTGTTFPQAKASPRVGPNSLRSMQAER